MNVALCAPYAFTRVSGVSAFLRSLEAGLRAGGHSVTVLTPDRAQWIDRLPTGLRDMGLSAWTMTHLLFARSPWTAIHANQPHLQSAAALVVARITGARFIVTYHSPMPPAARRVVGWSQELWHRILLGASDTIAFVSEATRAAYAGADGPVVRIGPDIRAAEEYRNRAGPRASPFTFIFAGRQTRSKGFFDFLEAAARLARRGERGSFRIVLVGETPQNEVAEKARRIEPIREIVQDAGVFTDREVLSWIAQAHVLVLPSYREGLPLTILEAMALACVPIASNVGGIPEIVRDRRTGILVPPGDVEALEAAMLWAIQHPQEVETMGQSASNDIRTSLSFDSTLAQYIALYQGSRRSLQDNPASHVNTE